MPQRESAILTLSDLHFGKLTPTYSPDIFAEQVRALGDKLKRIRSLLSDYAFDELVICMLGDAPDGGGIYPTQYHHQDITDPNKQAKILAGILAAFAAKQKNVWGSVRFECVPGNHGRTGQFTHEDTNWDVVCYDHLESKLERYEIPVHQNEGDNLFIRKIKVRGHSYLLYHGHDIRMYQTIPWYGLWQRTLRWFSSAKLSPFDAILIGHFHSAGEWKLNRVNILLSGTFVTSDEWALQTFGVESANSMWLFGVSDSRPITWRFAMDVG